MAKTSWWDKMTGRKNALPVDLKEKINVDGKDVDMKELLDALEPEKPKFNDDSVFETAHGEKSLADLKNAYRNKVKKNTAEVPDGEVVDPTKGAAAAEAGHAEHKEAENAVDEKCATCNGSGKKNSEGETEKLPDLRAEKSADEKAAEEKKNADDTKAAEEKKNADAEAAEEKKNAEDLAKKELKDAADAEEAKRVENRNAGRRSFEDLRNARGEEADKSVIMPAGLGERLARGKEKYGKTA